jgi:hypothetical protein
MKKQKPLILQIPQPCSESWAAMKPMGLGRFCSHCQKTVTDITNMSDKQIVQLFQQNTDNHCIRAFASQLNRPIALPPQAPTRFYRIALALGLTILSFAAADTYARPRPPLVEQNYLLGVEDSTKRETASGDTISISGIVLDETGAPFPGVIVKIKSGGLMKGGAITEDDGNFEIILNKVILDATDLSIIYSSLAYKTIIEKINKVDLVNSEFRVKMSADDNILSGDLIFIEYQKPIIEKPGQKTFNANDIKKMGY